jgi:hypothetical protein
MAIRLKIDANAFKKLDDVQDDLHTIIWASLMDLGSDLRAGTPVDTGFAANSWSESANGSPGPIEGHEGPTEGPDAAVLHAAVGGVASFNNSAVYIRRLNQGHSPQAPAGWVEETANRLWDHLEKHAMFARRR